MKLYFLLVRTVYISVSWRWYAIKTSTGGFELEIWRFLPQWNLTSREMQNIPGLPIPRDENRHLDFHKSVVFTYFSANLYPGKTQGESCQSPIKAFLKFSGLK